MDIWVAATRENSEKLVAVLRDFGFGGKALTPELFLEPDHITRMGNPPLRIEIMTTVSGIEFSDAYAARVNDVIDDTPVTVIGREHLIANKRASGRLKDLADIDNLP
jgi:hypothetical protein